MVDEAACEPLCSGYEEREIVTTRNWITHEEAIRLLGLTHVLQAYVGGKPIQLRWKFSDGAWSEWQDLNGAAAFLNENTEWRVKPEPREFWIACGRAFSNRMVALSCNHSSEEIVHVREIL